MLPDIFSNLPWLIETVGVIGVIAIVYAESGLLIGFFLPGDSLLFTAGLLASQGYLSLPALLIGGGIAAILGDSTGYWFGKKVGPRLFNREDSLLFHKDHIARTQQFFEKHGPKTIILARFFPVIRTFAPMLAGVGKMHYRTFLLYNVVGAIIWAVGVPLMGYTLGSLVPNAEDYLLPIVVVIVLTSFLPPIIDLIKRRRSSRTEKTSIG